VTSAPEPVPSRALPRTPLLLRTWLWGWAAIAQLVLDLLLAGPYLVLFAVLVGGLSSLPAIGVGLVLVVPSLVAAMFVARFERLRIAAFTGVDVPAPAPPRRTGPLWRTLLLDMRPWRAAAHLTLVAFWGLLVGTVTTVLLSLTLALAALPLYRAALPGGRISPEFGPSLPAGTFLWVVGLAGLVVLPLVARGLVGVDVALARWLIGPRTDAEQVAELTRRVRTLTHTREMTVDSVELERRRIERDLHDGPQQRLVALAMDLGMAQRKLDDDPEAARRLLAKAHAAAKEAIVEMRQVARGIHPPVLTDRGLDAALSALAARAPMPVTIRVDLPVRPSPTIESIAYFCVSEALTNVAKHSGARAATVDVTRSAEGVTVVVADDGRGGADPTRGTGLAGLRQRLAAVDGTLAVDSPPGAGTRLLMTLPDRTTGDAARATPPPTPAPTPTPTPTPEPTATPTATPTPTATADDPAPAPGPPADDPTSRSLP
jgi:signal transduction histidine kinase